MVQGQTDEWQGLCADTQDMCFDLPDMSKVNSWLPDTGIGN